ncbi:MAG: OsmC family protein [Spongiibacteraceae bacterium]
MSFTAQHYRVEVVAASEGPVSLTSDGVVTIESDAPVEFGGPGGSWSPESLHVAAMADCFALSFRAIARAAKLSWVSLNCCAEGTLEKQDGKLMFTRYHIVAKLKVSDDRDHSRAEKLLAKAEDNCLIANSVTGTVSLEVQLSS